MLELELTEMIIAGAAALVAVVAAFVGHSWGKVKGRAAATPNKIDDAFVATVETAVRKIVSEKMAEEEE